MKKLFNNIWFWISLVLFIVLMIMSNLWPEPVYIEYRNHNIHKVLYNIYGYDSLYEVTNISIDTTVSYRTIPVRLSF